jgi:predicted O-methyltransferase YrrM
MTARRFDKLRECIERLVAEPPKENERTLLAPLNEWAVSLGTAQLLAGLVQYLSPQSVLEFGAGRSSLVLAGALQGCGGGRLTSIEHQPAYVEQAWQKMMEFTAVDARLVHASLRVRFSKHGLLHEYGGIGDALRARGPFDFIFIDGPPGHLGRDATLLAAAPFLRAGTVVVLDDATRPMEQTAMRRWSRALAIEQVFESDTVGRGVAVMKVAHPISPAFSLRTFVGTIHDRILEWWRSNPRTAD